MTNYKFQQIKNEIIDFMKGYSNFKKVFIVRNIYSRFSIYFVDFSENLHDFEYSLRAKFNDWVESILNISEIEDNFIYNDLINSSKEIQPNPSIFFSERHIENTNWYISDQFHQLKAPVISFYSFKGGVGRTTATILTALLLAREGKKVLLIDFDLEAPGLASVFAQQENNTEKLLAVKGVIDFFIDFEANKRQIDKINIDDYYFINNSQLLVGSNGGEIVIVPAIATDNDSAESYIDKLSKSNIKYGFGKDYLPDLFLKKMEEKINPDYIFIDTRTGINDVGGIVFKRYSQTIFLIFYGNQQNMFGLRSIVPELKNLDNKNVKFYLVNSPVPENSTDAEIETNYYIQKSYEIFSDFFYDKNNLPSLFDETADHYPIQITYNRQAVIINNFQKLSDLIDNSKNPYKKIAEIIKRNDDVNITTSINKDSSKNNILDCIANIDKGSGTSEVEFKSEKDLTTYFYPRKDYKYIFDKDKFLILGEKGVGKTALFSVLSFRNYAKALANFCGIKSEDFDNTSWVIGLEKDSRDFPAKANYESLKDFQQSQFRNYWIILLLRRISEELLDKNNILIQEIRSSEIKDIKDIAQRENIGEELFEILKDVNSKLTQNNKLLIIVYDHLDAELPSENGIRGKLVSSLLSLFYDNLGRFNNLKAKIFLRKDIFDREVDDITDKVKIQNYSVTIDWEYVQLLNIVWKRIYEQNRSLSIFNGINFNKIETLGYIPEFNSEKEHTLLLDKIFGKNMGGNNKAYPYNWVRIHIEDTKNQIHPRTLIKLFSESAKLQKEDKEEVKDRVIRSKNIQDSLINVSKHQVQELGEEYPELKDIFKKLSEKVGGRSPMNENDLINALRELNAEPLDTISKLKDIGVLKDYKPYSKTKTSNEEKRYHIPDLYLFGLNFTRLGTR